MFIKSVYERGAPNHKGNDVNTVNTRIERVAGEIGPCRLDMSSENQAVSFVGSNEPLELTIRTYLSYILNCLHPRLKKLYLVLFFETTSSSWTLILVDDN